MQKNIIFTKFIAICLLATFFLFNNNVFAKTKKPSKEINLVINNSMVESLDTYPIIIDGYTFVPVRGVFEILGAVVDWDQKTHEVLIAYKDSIIELEINKKTAQIDNKVVSMDIPAKIINNRTMIPVRFIAESFGFKVNWDKKTKTVYILSDIEDNSDINNNDKDKNSNKDTDDNQSIKEDNNKNTNDQNIKDNNSNKDTDDNQSIKGDNNKDTNDQNVKDNNNKDTSDQNIKDNNNKDTSDQNVKDNSNKNTNDQNIKDNNNKDTSDQNIKDNNNKDTSNQNIKDNNNNDTSNQNIKDNSNKNTNDQNVKDNNSNNFNNKKVLNISNNTNNIIKVQDVIIPQENEPQVFKIKTSGAMSKVESFTLDDNRLVIDIYNAQLEVPNKEFNSLNNNWINTIKLGQNQIENQKVTRVVFNLKDMISYDIQFEKEDNILEVIFNKSNILDINISKDSESDYIRITGDIAPYLKYSIDDDILTILAKNINIDNISQSNFTGNFIKEVKITKEGDSTLKLTANLKKETTALLMQEGNTTTLKLNSVTYKNIKFNSQTNMLTLVKNNSKKIDINEIVHKDDYINNKYILTLPGNYYDIYGYGICSVNNSNYLSSFDIETLGENTDITLNSKKIIAVNITEDNNNIYIKLVLPKEKYSKILVLDPGHGGKDPGNIGINGLHEKNVTLDISNRVIDLLKQDNIQVYATRQIDSYPTLDDRVNIANEVADLFVSIHLNSADQVGKKNPIPNGTEVYYYVNDTDSKFNISKKEVANIFKNNIISSLGTNDRGIKTAGFVVIKKTKMPSVLLELGFLSNAQEADKFKQEDFKDKAANAIYKSIKEVFEKYKPIR